MPTAEPHVVLLHTRGQYDRGNGPWWRRNQSRLFTRWTRHGCDEPHRHDPGNNKGTQADNSDGNCSVDTLTDGGYNLSSDASCSFSSSTSLAGTDPLLAPLNSNGGPTQTMALLVGSPAIDLIPPGINGCGTTIATDQRGVSRPVGSGCDVGAYEDATAPVQLAYLRTAVTGVKSLTATVAIAQSLLAHGHTKAACLTVAAFNLEVRLQAAGKKISKAQAASFISEAKSIEALLGC